MKFGISKIVFTRDGKGRKNSLELHWRAKKKKIVQLKIYMLRPYMAGTRSHSSRCNNRITVNAYIKVPR